MTQQSKQPNTALTEAVDFVRDTLKGGDHAPYHFVALINHLLTKTIAKPTSFVQVHQGDSKHHYTIAPPRRTVDEMVNAPKGNELYRALELADNRFLAMRFDLFVDDVDSFLKTNSSRYAYQHDELGYEQIIRFDMARQPTNHYPFSHLHVYGAWSKPYDGLKELDKIHFPTPRTSIEALIRLLIHDFGIKPNEAHDIYEPMLAATEAEFMKVARTSPKLPQPGPNNGTEDDC